MDVHDGAELRRIREDELGMSQERLAEALGVYQRTISQWERGERGIRHPRMLGLALQQLRRAVDVAPAELAREDEDG